MPQRDNNRFTRLQLAFTSAHTSRSAYSWYLLDADIARVAPNFPIPRTEEQPSCPQTLWIMPPRVNPTAIQQVNPAVSQPETQRSINVLPVHSPLSHPPLADCVAPTQSAPQGTNCGSVLGIGFVTPTLPAQIVFFPQIPKHLMEIFETIRQISIVLFDFLLPQIFNCLMEVFVAISSLTGVPIDFFPQDSQYSEGEFFGRNAFNGRPNFSPGFSIGFSML